MRKTIIILCAVVIAFTVASNTNWDVFMTTGDKGACLRPTAQAEADSIGSLEAAVP